MYISGIIWLRIAKYDVELKGHKCQGQRSQGQVKDSKERQFGSQQHQVAAGHRQLIFWYSFPSDSSKMDPTQIKKHLHHFIFLLPPDSAHISRTTGPTEMVHLSMFAGLNREYLTVLNDCSSNYCTKIDWKLDVKSFILWLIFFLPSLKLGSPTPKVKGQS